jgi:hypothetical protein
MLLTNTRNIIREGNPAGGEEAEWKRFFVDSDASEHKVSTGLIC